MHHHGDTLETDTDENVGTLILDATCVSQNISLPQDVNFLNEAREYLKGIVDDLCRRFGSCVKQVERHAVIDKVYEQQKDMYEQKMHSVPDRIVSIIRSCIRPIVRGEVTTPVEFGAPLGNTLRERDIIRNEF